MVTCVIENRYKQCNHENKMIFIGTSNQLEAGEVNSFV